MSMELFERKGHYYIRYSRKECPPNGKLVSLKSIMGFPVTNSVKAKEIFDELSFETLQDKLTELKGTSRITIDDFVKLYADSGNLKCPRADLADNTLRADRNSMKYLAAAVGKQTLASITDQDLITFKNLYLEKGASPHTIRSYFRHQRAAFRWAKENGFINKVPKIPTVKAKRALPRSIKEKHLDAILNFAKINQKKTVLQYKDTANIHPAKKIFRASGIQIKDVANRLGIAHTYLVSILNGRVEASPELEKKINDHAAQVALAGVTAEATRPYYEIWRYAQFSAWTGCREDECIKLKCQDVQIYDEPEGMIVGEALVTGKGDKERIVYLLPPAIEAIGKINDIGPVFKQWTGSAIAHKFKECVRAVGAPDTIRFHDLRHTAATRLLTLGIPEHVVQRILGHVDVRTTQKYTAVVDTHMKDELNKAFAKYKTQTKQSKSLKILNGHADS